ncbi:hypothetical protein [Oenococcus sp.]|uniref:hypothetical protein n=1 Tax=Oenococcus sp. TaxID=1979414 RepID=UPI0039EB1A5D
MQNKDFTLTDKIILFALTAHVFVGRYFFPSDYQIWMAALIAVFLFICYQRFFDVNDFLHKKKMPMLTILYLASIFFLIANIIGNLLSLGVGLLAVNNLLMVFSPILLLVFFCYLFDKYDSKLLWKFFNWVLTFSNIYFWLNVPIIILEKMTSSFMIAKFISWNPYIPDSITGLIGYSGTNIINLFWVSLLVSNVIYFYFNRKRLLIWLTLAEGLFMLYFSIFYNENKSFIPTAVVFGLVLALALLDDQNLLTFLIRFFGGIIILIVSGAAIYFIFPDFRPYINQLLGLGSQLIEHNGQDTTNERAYLIQMAFQKYQAARYGVGLNVLDLNTQNIHIHLAINSLSLLLYMGGIRFYVVALAFYGLYLKNFLSFAERPAYKLITWVGLLAALFLVTVISQPFRDYYILYFFSWFVFSVALTVRLKEEAIKVA